MVCEFRGTFCFAVSVDSVTVAIETEEDVVVDVWVGVVLVVAAVSGFPVDGAIAVTAEGASSASVETVADGGVSVFSAALAGVAVIDVAAAVSFTVSAGGDGVTVTVFVSTVSAPTDVLEEGVHV